MFGRCVIHEITCTRGAISSIFRVTSTVIGPYGIVTVSIDITVVGVVCTLVNV